MYIVLSYYYVDAKLKLMIKKFNIVNLNFWNISQICCRFFNRSIPKDKPIWNRVKLIKNYAMISN